MHLPVVGVDLVPVGGNLVRALHYAQLVLLDNSRANDWEAGADAGPNFGRDREQEKGDDAVCVKLYS